MSIYSLITNGGGGSGINITPVIYTDNELNTSVKTITLHASLPTLVTNIRIKYTATSTSNDRYIWVAGRDAADNDLYEIAAYTPVPAGATKYIEYGLGHDSATTYSGLPGNENLMLQSIPWVVLPAGAYLFVYDAAIVDEEADDMLVTVSTVTIGG